MIVLVLTGIILVVTALRPVWGVLLVGIGVAAAGPLHVALADAGVVEKIVVAFLFGATIRFAIDRQPSPSRLARPALVLALICMGWGITQLSSEQQTRSWMGVYLTDLWRHITNAYFVGPGRFSTLHEMVRWIEGLALAVCAEKILRRSPNAWPSAARLLIVAAAAVGLASVFRLYEISLRSNRPWMAALQYFQTIRFSPFYADLNAAGSYYVLFLVAGWGLAIQRRRVWLWAAVATLAIATWFAGSRAAMAAAVCGAAVILVANRRPQKRMAVIAGGLVIALAAGALWKTERHMPAWGSLSIRMGLAKSGLRLAAEHPVFGIGLGHYQAASIGVLPPDLVATFPGLLITGENAHNNFLQILVELGAAGLLTFLWLLVSPAAGVFRAMSARTASPELISLTGGMVAFLVSCLFGHPLLIPDIFLVFFLMLGVIAGLTPGADAPSPRPRTWKRSLGNLIVIVAVLTVPFRVAEARRSAVLRNVVIGASNVVGEVDGIPYRVTEQDSSWFLPGVAHSGDMPLRLAGQSGSSCIVEIAIDGRAANQVLPTRDTWTHITLPLRTDEARVRHRVDLHVTGDTCSVMVGRLAIRE